MVVGTELRPHQDFLLRDAHGGQIIAVGRLLLAVPTHSTLAFMCGRITQKTNPHRLCLGLTTLSLVEPLEALPRYNRAPGQPHWLISQNAETGERTLDRLTWGLIPRWVKDAKGGIKPVNAKAESISTFVSRRLQASAHTAAD